MRRLLLSAVALALLVAGCGSSSEPMAVDLAQPMAPPPTPVSISGAAVDEGIVCSSGMFVDNRLEDMDGNPIGMEEWGAMFEAAVDTGSVAEVTSHNDYECDDGSGTITVSQHVRFDFAVIDIETFGRGRFQSGTWTVGGTGDYETLTGSGEIVDDHDEGLIHMVGEVEA
jgi:hypothetical protein